MNPLSCHSLENILLHARPAVFAAMTVATGASSLSAEDFVVATKSYCSSAEFFPALMSLAPISYSSKIVHLSFIYGLLILLYL